MGWGGGKAHLATIAASPWCRWPKGLGSCGKVDPHGSGGGASEFLAATGCEAVAVEGAFTLPQASPQPLVGAGPAHPHSAAGATAGVAPSVLLHRCKG